MSQDVLAYGASIFLGVVAGALVQFALGLIEKKFAQRKLVALAKFELEFIINTKVPSWAEQLQTLRRRITEHRQSTIVIFLDLNAAPTHGLHKLIDCGYAYDRLGNDDLPKLLQLIDKTKPESQQIISQRAEAARLNQNVPAALAEIDFFDHYVAEASDLAGQIYSKL